MERYSAEWWREYRANNAERLRAYKRQYDAKRYKTHNESELARRYRWKANKPDGHKAHLVVFRAIKRGELLRQPCEICGGSRVDAHHDDYSKPLEVRWLCPVHHAARHRKAA
jgi:hypothetical protein